jgi:hypothetical protein
MRCVADEYGKLATLGGRRITIERPRARSVDAVTELELPSFRFAADRDPLDERTMEAIAVSASIASSGSVGSVKFASRIPSTSTAARSADSGSAPTA